MNDGDSSSKPQNPSAQDLPDAGHTPEIARTPGLMERLRGLVGFRAHASLREDLQDVLDEAGSDGADLRPEERAMLRNILGLREVKVVDVMVPRADIVAVEESITLGDLLKQFRENGHSRLPIYRDSLDDPLGMIHIRDLIAYIITGAPLKRTPSGRRMRATQDLDLGKIDLTTPLSASKLKRPVLFVPPSMPALDLLSKMQASRMHIALVIDEYGGTDGLVSIEDLVEVIVGDIEDEHDENEVVIQPMSDGEGWNASARASLEDVREAVGPEFELSIDEEAAEEVDTLGGLLVWLAGRVPVRGELLAGPGGYEFEVLDADPRRVKRVRIRRTREAGAAAPDEATAEPQPAPLPPVGKEA